jgi:hypothetical protein|tara:strand:+ start:516 stop:1394 length:879 start_codon:yes stop_codon:yes gene_type:complete
MSEQQIELVLPEEEVDIHEADVIQEKQPDDDHSEQKATTEEHTTEVDQYSDSVKKRIDKLTYRMREAERQRDQALTYAQSVYKEKQSLQTRLSSSDANLVSEYDARVKSEGERARNVLKEAQELGDSEAIVLATEAVAKSALEEQNVKRAQSRQKIQNRRQSTSNRQNNQVNSNQQRPDVRRPDPQAEAWAEKNPWFGEDKPMTGAAVAIDESLRQEGVDPTSQDYYQQLDAQLKEYFPNKFEQQKTVQQVAGSSRGVGASNRGARQVSLSPSQIAIAKRIGVPLEEYAKYV